MKVIKIGAAWCPGCLIMRPRWEEIEKENPWIVTEYFDYDDHKEELKGKYGLGDELPIFIFIDKDGQEIARLAGEPDKEMIMELADRYKEK